MSGIEISSDRQPIFVSDLDCDGNIHDHILDCNSSPYGRLHEKCSHRLDVWVQCEGMKPLCDVKKK